MTTPRIIVTGRNAWVRPCRLMDWQRHATSGPLHYDARKDVLGVVGWVSGLVLVSIPIAAMLP